MSWSYDCFYADEWHSYCDRLRFLTQEETANYAKDEVQCPIRFVETNERPTHAYVNDQLEEIRYFGLTRAELRTAGFVAWSVISTTISTHGLALPLWAIAGWGMLNKKQQKTSPTSLR